LKKKIPNRFATLIGQRSLQTSSPQKDLNNPFSRNSKGSIKKDFDAFINDKYLKEQLKPDKELQLEASLNKRQGMLPRLVQKLFNPKQLNVRFREEFSLGESYKLIYLLEQERMQLLLYSSLCLLTPLLIACLGSLLIAELTGYSKLNESFENVYLFLGFTLIYMCGVFAVLIVSQRANIMRIYFDEAANKCVAIRLNGFFR